MVILVEMCWGVLNKMVAFIAWFIAVVVVVYLVLVLFNRVVKRALVFFFFLRETAGSRELSIALLCSFKCLLATNRIQVFPSFSQERMVLISLQISSVLCMVMGMSQINGGGDSG